jgi:phosphoglycolate phosphatase-like HAD superfamily hydrolase
MNKVICKTRGFLFDFDGTLVDTMHGYADIAGRLIHEQHPSTSFEEGRRRYIETSGIPFCQQIEIIFPEHPKNAETVRRFEEEKIEGFFATRIENDVKDSISKMRERGYLVGVSSGNFPHLINDYVAREKVTFDIVMGYDHDNRFEKGAPHFDHFLSSFKLGKKDLTFVGDSLKDADKGYEYGIQFVGMLGLFSDDDFRKRYADIVTVGSMRELAEYL